MFGQVLGCDKGFLVTTEFFWFCVALGVPYVATWLASLMQFLGRDIVFPCRDIVFPCRDNVLLPCQTMSRPRWSRQEISCFNRFGLG